MNLIQAWKENSKERWTCDGVTISFYKSSTFDELIRKLYGDKILLADNWKIAKKKKEEGMKSPEELYKEHYYGFTCNSVADAYKKGFLRGADLALKEIKGGHFVAPHNSKQKEEKNDK